ncbi:uncharacterized protein AMSG_07850 [Thecamonas trahens ATCC 50062]|uniref:Uncharacterized protein n=1 Tax=Thecamonas trahens ATCC 50062 TaxID=461836 RepID=A0A0L0DHS4_THETB|nr:hypothetical protein AMSG_07850 [Thecamonas trahens ATCC 50062]KNC51775.1 hypothetical protein AMSG_07850 [Thecamonas trahens ATCC 50062]|eukprot:XP_013755648.1 hypothetical protein AMSG_07850 [Thecamonas trahens ATCC 50062]
MTTDADADTLDCGQRSTHTTVICWTMASFWVDAGGETPDFEAYLSCTSSPSPAESLATPGTGAADDGDAVLGGVVEEAAVAGPSPAAVAEHDGAARQARLLEACLQQFGLTDSGLDLLDGSACGREAVLDVLQRVLEAYQGTLEEGKKSAEELRLARVALKKMGVTAEGAQHESDVRGEALTRLEVDLERAQTKARGLAQRERKLVAQLRQAKSEISTMSSQYTAERKRAELELDRLRKQLARKIGGGRSVRAAGSGRGRGRSRGGAAAGGRSMPRGLTAFLAPRTVRASEQTDAEHASGRVKLLEQRLADEVAAREDAHAANERLRSSLRNMQSALLEVFKVDELDSGAAAGAADWGSAPVAIRDIFGAGSYTEETAFLAEGMLEERFTWLTDLVSRASSYELLKIKADKPAAAPVAAPVAATGPCPGCLEAQDRIHALEKVLLTPAAGPGRAFDAPDCLNLSEMAEAEDALEFREQQVAAREAMVSTQTSELAAAQARLAAEAAALDGKKAKRTLTGR